jgi:hypothetical protein
MGHTLIDIECPKCGSRFGIKFKKVKTGDDKTFHQWITVKFKSPKAIEIESKNKPRPKNPYDRMNV